jgi:catechol 2,3-dioxygenase-like lactoylglutathione lyase family enzyme
MARIRHVAFYTRDPERSADFYCKAFDLSVVRKNERGNIWLSDGYINVALIKRSDGIGINHLGFKVEDLESAKDRITQLHTEVEVETPAEGVTAAEYKLKDPDGNWLDISERGWKV